ncbi:MAG: ATP-binding cassette domain-containing protein, partial [Pseudomonadales bacterium]|nr:ATP-binding cassette domain-containing protein [Pseudomonadales bacterium]
MSLVRVSHLGKAYRQYSSPWSRLAEWVRPSVQRHTLRWVLRGVEFTLEPGESVGIVGANGAGKSTLLKMIAGTTQCTEGSIEVNGQLSALLELGMGFHPDFTGRQNAIMSGQLIGLTLEQIKELMPFIEAFAEIGDYIDMPVRTYSSGMRMRLAFSVATANRPDVLIIDEALSVGDAYFQHKSFDRIRQLKNEGSSLLIVSHDRSAIQTICDRAILLEGGAVIRQGEPEDVLDFYNALMAKKEHDTIREEKLSRGGVTTISGTGEVEIAEIQLLNLVGDSIEVVGIGESVVVRVKVRVNQAVPSLIVGFM